MQSTDHFEFSKSSCRTTQFAPKYLNRYIRNFTVYKFEDTTPLMMYPGGYLEFIFQIHCDFEQYSIQSENRQTRPMNFVGGLHNQSFYIKPKQQNAQVISVKFKPDCAKYFIPDRLNLFKNKIVNLDDVIPGKKKHQIENLTANIETQERLDRIESFLMEIFRENNSSQINRAVYEIYHQKGFVTIETLAGKVCLSPQQFRKRFNEEVGLSPREYARIVRINHVLSLLRNKTASTLTQLTYQLGYFDQAHFIRDFKAVMGDSPKHFVGNA
ncbi:MAG: AraC family transcriptional regulator [Bacteroidales bacterium]|nr:AraC family transcriptional regulator [Bacteroidales bacterium]